MHYNNVTNLDFRAENGVFLMKSHKRDNLYMTDEQRAAINAKREQERRKNRRISNILLVLAGLFIIVAVIFFLIDPIKDKMREEEVDTAVSEIKQNIIIPDVTEFTYVVPKNANEVNGEEYDFYGDEEEQAQMRQEIEDAMEALPDDVTLNCLGLIEIPSIECCDPIWDNDSVIDLRYGIGHHRSSVLPGEEGNCCLLGHHMKKTGVFFNRLIEVQVGDTIKITTIDKKEFTYIVDKTVVIDPSVLEDYVDADDGEGTQITLVSCTYTNTGKMRIIVIGHILEGED